VTSLHRQTVEVLTNSALVNDACGRRFRAFFSASQRGR
jgi:hypothetical protein